MPELLSDDELNQKLAERAATSVTKEYMESRIAKTEFHVIQNSTVTICSITLDNGYSVRGESACVNPDNFNKEIGERIAHDNAFKNLWPLFGFLLAEKNYIQAGRPGSVGEAA